MKVIGKIAKDKYICEVSHIEIEKFLDQYYGKLKNLEVGSEIDMGKGYDFMLDTTSALKETKQFLNKNAKIIKKIIEGIDIMGE